MSDDCVTVIVGAFTADGTTPDGDGICWTVARLDGWFDSAAVRVATQEVQPFGQTITLARENARAIVLELVAHMPGGQSALGPNLCFLAVESIAVPFKAVYAPVVFEVIDPVLDLHANVRRVGPIRSAMIGQSAAMRFQIPLLAEDPYRYDASDNPFD